MSGTMAITMAGAGSRFTKAGFNLPKYEIDALERPLFDWSMLSLTAFRDEGWRFSFVTRSNVGAEAFIRQRCEDLGFEISEILELDSQTDGQASTALLAAENATESKPFAVYNIDTYVEPGLMIPPKSQKCAGWIPCFSAPGDGWSFARLGPSGLVEELREKKRISEHATVGLYWFESAATYINLYNEHFSRSDGEEKGERYIAPMYNRLIEKAARVEIMSLPLESVGMLGTPEQVAMFIENPPPSAIEIIKKR